MNNHIKTCPYCQGDGVVPKDWEDIKVGDKLFYNNLYDILEGGKGIEVAVTVVKKVEVDDNAYRFAEDFWMVEYDNISIPLYKCNFVRFVKE